MELERLLLHYFGYPSFRMGQKEIIADVLSGHNVLAVLPTGSGKSICYQIPAMKLPGSVLVVSPLLSLMEDQVKQLKQTGFKQVVAINSFLNERDKHTVFHHLADYKLIYLSPEMLQNSTLLDRLKQLDISLFVIDEAHCISQWGHEFRPDYLRLNDAIEVLNHPPILALSATATAEVQADIIAQFNGIPVEKHIYPMDRENIAFIVKEMTSNQDKDRYLIELFTQYPVPTMIYFSSKKEAERVSSKLTQELTKLRIAYYHGGMETLDRILIQQQFLEGQLDVICCTSAFGMGIDKSDVRLVIHYHIPTQVESFIQEIGRAGRDGLSSVSIVLYTAFDHLIPKRLIAGELPDIATVEPIINRLSQLVEKLDDRQALDQFDLTEVQWRFLFFQLEKHGMIKENHILPVDENKTAIITAITNKITERFQYKSDKLSEMLQWISHKDTCRRTEMYRSFQPTIKQPTYHCCDCCGFRLSDWKPIINQSIRGLDDWELELKHLFLQTDIE